MYVSDGIVIDSAVGTVVIIVIPHSGCRDAAGPYQRGLGPRDSRCSRQAATAGEGSPGAAGPDRKLNNFR